MGHSSGGAWSVWFRVKAWPSCHVLAAWSDLVAAFYWGGHLVPASCRQHRGLAPAAGMVKLLRRGMKELQNRTQQFIDHAVAYEKEAAQQV